ncbi:transcription-repair coupling factor [Anaerolentibacter hominis]|uniref:transcription-repair coupling factor n=1 Tax=Anaerolentibacter hominis TaxID=3079009 RepID=UPI003CCEE2EB
MAPLEGLSEFQIIREQVQKQNLPISVSGCIDSQKCHLMYGLGEGFQYRVIVAANELKAKEICEEYRLYDKKAVFYPAKDIIFYSADVHGNAIVAERMKVIRSLLKEEPCTIVTTLDAGMDSILPLETIRKNILQIKEAEVMDLDQWNRALPALGYERVPQVEASGQFAVRGGILDIFPLTEETPYRIELWDDEVDTIRAFDVESQRSIERVEKLTIYPASEFILDDARIAAGCLDIEADRKKQTAILREQGNGEAAKRLDTIVEELKENLSFLWTGFGLDSYIRYFYKTTVSFFDYFIGKNAIFFLDEPARMIEKGEAVETEFRESMSSRLEHGYLLPRQTEVLFGYRLILEKLNHQNSVLISMMEAKIPGFDLKGKYNLTVKSVNPYNNNFEILVKDLKDWKKKGYRVLLLSGSRTRAKRLSEDLLDRELTAFYTENLDREIQPGETMVAYAQLRRGFEYPLSKFVMISESDIFGAEKKKRRKKKYNAAGKSIQSFEELSAGDYVVHENHGLGIYRGIEKIEVDKVTKDYVKIEYAAGGVLYIPATGLEVLQKYASSDAKKPKLNKLNSIEWKNTKTKVRGAVNEIAKELVDLYAVRQAREGFSYGKDTVWQKEFEEQFPYEETDDQLMAIEAAKKDMESKKIMDRLICGDVGYGKTEIAIRAAFKAVSDGKQVVFLVPTTILAQQHYNTFTQRMKDYPITVEMLSRFRTPGEQKKIIEDLKKGRIDIIIGTHRVLSKGVAYKDLGLLIIDEEQRFGVTHKEKIKQMKENVDVLTLSATPIPRTLHMSLIGIRDMSVLEEPPVDRMPIQTFVLEHNDEIIREAINRELARGGQVYYVYNRVNNIAEVTAEIAKLVPDATVAFAHGQMHERELERIMFDFINGEIDVLVSTTIVETGMDIANVNTMIIEDADRMGLSQLYQLRGRVGRSNRTAYAFLMYRRNKVLKEVAEKRLQVIREFTELGSGFKIAMRDLEIRGAGNLLGARQHGHMEAVGYDLYCKMLNDAVKRLKGEATAEEAFDTSVDLDVDAFIPNSYMKSEFQKLDMYKRIADIENEEEYNDMQEELLDRFGEMPQAVSNLLQIALLKARAHKAYITQLAQKGNLVKIVMFAKARVDAGKIPALIEKYNGALKFYAEAEPNFHFQLAYQEPEKPPVRPVRTVRRNGISTLTREQKLKTITPVRQPEKLTNAYVFERINQLIEDMMKLQEGLEALELNSASADNPN